MISAPALALPAGVTLHGELAPGFDQILTFESLGFVATLHRRFQARRLELLAARETRQLQLEAGEQLDFLPDTQSIRLGDWQVAPVPEDLQDRRVEITGPVDRKMIINALNSGAKVFMADLEDSNSPTWFNCIQGQINLHDAVRRTLSFYDTRKDKSYQLNEALATLMVRPRGWHLEDKHVLIDGVPVSGSLLDFGLYFYHNAHALLDRGTGPYFYLPKLESHVEARLWNDVFVLAQSLLDLPLGTIKATVLIETITASFELHEILYELRDHSAGLNCGRWDYIFSFIKRLGRNPEAIIPNRAQVGMTVPFMKAYSELVIQTCHRRGIHAMGGMAAQIPIKHDPVANEAALAKVAKDKEREAKAGHDGTWVAHPGLVAVAMEQFDTYMPQANQIDKKREDVNVTAADLVELPKGTITETGLRTNIDVGIQYIEAWLRGNGCVPIYHLMEDAATAEISRTQVWQWVKYGAMMDDGTPVTAESVQKMIPEQLAHIKELIGDELFGNGKFGEAAALFETMVLADQLEEFLTSKAYAAID